ncbi:MAG: hypothetical protein IPO88_20495 [Nannocystis sp.]|uniref:hypothetical protein n=1 Tax=Nannocystis sp. TaxID=1962667 RepID=UPI002425C214|nr:hypothetical protein [Nannocystis sp.]MBK9755838.1 hypothetical protein [Nannocystis sp.]
MLEHDVAPLKVGWQQIPAAFNIETALIYSTRTTQDGEARISAQTRDVGSTLEPLPLQAHPLPVHILSQPPHDYSLQNIDGVILLLGRQRIARTKSSVYWVDPRHFIALHHDGDLATFLKTSESTNIGTITFAPESDTLVDSDTTALHIALRALPTFNANRPLVAHAFCDANHPDADLLKKRVRSLVAALKLIPHLTATTEHLKPRTELPGPNPMIILLSSPPLR